MKCRNFSSSFYSNTFTEINVNTIESFRNVIDAYLYNKIYDTSIRREFHSHWNDNKLILWYLEINGLFMRLVWTPTFINITIEHINHFNYKTMLTKLNNFMLTWHDIMYVILYDVSCRFIVDVGSILEIEYGCRSYTKGI